MNRVEGNAIDLDVWIEMVTGATDYVSNIGKSFKTLLTFKNPLVLWEMF